MARRSGARTARQLVLPGFEALVRPARGRRRPAGAAPTKVDWEEAC